MLTVLERLEGRAYRDGRLVCARAVVTVVADASRARGVRVRFADGVDERLRGELERLMACRGAVARRLAERLDPVEVAGRDDAGSGREWRLAGRLERPAAQYWPPADAEFWLRAPAERASAAGENGAGADGRLGPASLRRGRGGAP